MFSTTSTPKCTRSMPSERAVGSSMGTKTSNSTDYIQKQPSAEATGFTSSRNAGRVAQLHAPPIAPALGSAPSLVKAQFSTPDGPASHPVMSGAGAGGLNFHRPEGAPVQPQATPTPPAPAHAAQHSSRLGGRKTQIDAPTSTSGGQRQCASASDLPIRCAAPVRSRGMLRRTAMSGSRGPSSVPLSENQARPARNRPPGRARNRDAITIGNGRNDGAQIGAAFCHGTSKARRVLRFRASGEWSPDPDLPHRQCAAAHAEKTTLTVSTCASHHAAAPQNAAKSNNRSLLRAVLAAKRRERMVRSCCLARPTCSATNPRIYLPVGRSQNRCTAPATRSGMRSGNARQRRYRAFPAPGFVCAPQPRYPWPVADSRHA